MGLLDVPYIPPTTAYKTNNGVNMLSSWAGGTATVKTAVGTCTAQYDDTVTLAGARSLKITQGADGSGAAVVTLPEAVDMAGLDNFCFAFRFDSNIASDPGVNKFYIVFYFSDGTYTNHMVDCKMSAPNMTHVLTYARFKPDNVTSSKFGGGDWFDSKKVTQIGVITETTTLMGVSANLWFGFIGFNFKTKSKLLLGFDGNYITQKTILLPMLEEFGLKANFYIQKYTLGASGRFSNSDLAAIYALGHSVCMHSYSKDANYTEVAEYPTATLQSDAVSEMTGYKNWATTNGYLRGLDHYAVAIASPFDYGVGTQTNARMLSVLAAVNQVGAKTYRLGYPINNWATFEDNDVSRRTLDFFVSQLNSHSGGPSGIDINSATEARSQVQYAVRQGMTKMFYGHTFTNSGATGTLTANRDVLYALLDEISQQIAKGKATNPTIDEVYT